MGLFPLSFDAASFVAVALLFICNRAVAAACLRDRGFFGRVSVSTGIAVDANVERERDREAVCKRAVDGGEVAAASSDPERASGSTSTARLLGMTVL